MLTGDNQTLTAMAALVMWPIVCLCIFASSKSLSRSLIWTVLGAQLLLPVAASIKIQMVPQIDKASIASLSALLGCLMFGQKTNGVTSRFGLVEILMILTVITPIITSELNPDNLVIGGRFIPGVTLYDAISAAQVAVIALIPFLLGRRFLRTADDCHNILIILAISGLGYSIPLLFEIRFSPQLHNWTYGYYPSDFVQAVREGGFRPMVFMGHGLLAALFLMTSVLAAATLWRIRVRIGALPASIASPILGVVLLLCKSLGALIYAIAGFLLVFFCKPKTQFRVATVLVTISMAYPLLRSFELVPTKLIVEVAASIDNERAESLAYRFDNEDILLRRAFERPLFGWGRFGRNRVYDSNTGKDISVTDGRWVIVIGQFGLVGFLAEFGLLSICVLRAASAYRFAQSAKDQLAFATLGLIVSINIFDLLPNSGLTPWIWLLSGALLGYSETLLSARRALRPRTTTTNNVVVSTTPRRLSRHDAASRDRASKIGDNS